MIDTSIEAALAANGAAAKAGAQPDPARDARVARRARRRDRGRRRRARERAGARDRGARGDARRAHAGRADDAVRQHDRGRGAGAFSGRSRHRGAAAALHPLERDGDGRARAEGPQRAGRARRDVLVGGDAVRRRLQPLLARAVARRGRRPRVLPRSLVAGHLLARVHRRPHHRRAGRQLPARGRRQRSSVVPASVADAGLLAIRDRLDGARLAASRVPSALHALSARPRADRRQRSQGVGVSGRRRDRRARIARRARDGGAREARQLDLRRQLQLAAARRAGTRQRQDHPGARGRVPRRGLERDQGDLGFALGPAARGGRQRHAGQGDERDARR